MSNDNSHYINLCMYVLLVFFSNLLNSIPIKFQFAVHFHSSRIKGERFYALFSKYICKVLKQVHFITTSSFFLILTRMELNVIKMKSVISSAAIYMIDLINN